MSSASKAFVVNTQPTKQVVVSGLTKDATVRACIFDLTDNSIDAARNRLFAAPNENEVRDLPDSFADFKITLHVDKQGVKIQDNCGGIPVDNLRDMVLRFGRPSSHELGIGAYGVGLNRAIFKLGRRTHLSTDTGSQRAELILDVEKYLADDEWGLPASEFASTGNVGTEIELRSPPDEIAEELGGKDFAAELCDEIGRRYGRFLSRGLALVINGSHAIPHEISLRENGPFPIENKFYRTADGVAIFIKVGEHAQHRFKGESGYSAEANKQLTGEYGWTIYCNDRAILIADTTPAVGWYTKFHSEFYGFVASVSFVASDPSKLPWNTTKTDVDLNNSAYKTALDDMRRFSEGWRTFTDRYKKARRDHAAIPPAPAAQGTSAPASPRSGDRSVVPPAPSASPLSSPKVGHNDLRFVLPADISEHHCQDKFLEIVREAKTLDIGTHSYAALALLRMVFEFSVVTYMNRAGKGQELVDFAITRREQQSGKLIKDRKAFNLKLDEALAFLKQNPEIWGPLVQNHVKHSIDKLASHAPTINGALHNPFQAIHRSFVFQIRDEALHALRHLIEQPLP
jgi:hypothetical protein